MRRAFKIVLWVSVVSVALLGGLSIYGAFIGAKRAGTLFNSAPLGVFWVLLTLLLILGFVLFKRLRNSPGLLFAHLGPILILVGAMFASRTGYNLARKYLNETRVESGVMELHEAPSGTAIDKLAVRDIWNSQGSEIIGRLPFALALKKFDIAYHDADKPWRLGINAPPEGDSHERRVAEIEWQQGTDIQIPFVGGTVKVLKYVRSARLVMANREQFKLDVTDADGERTVVLAKVGQTVEVANPRGTLRIVEVFTNLVTRNRRGKRYLANLPGSYENPALRLLFTDADGKETQMWALTKEANFDHGVANLKAVYIVPAPQIVEDPDTQLPAMQILITRNGRQKQTWLIAARNAMSVSTQLPTALGAVPSSEAHRGHGHDPQTHLVMSRPSGMPRQYYASLVILEGGRKVGEKTIWVNNPLHYGGYHFYQANWDHDRGAYTVLNMKYDAGLWPVYAGFFMLCVGPFWLFWFKPAWNYFKRRQANGI